MVLEDWQCTVTDTAEIIRTSYEHVYHILPQKLGMKELCARQMPYLSSSDQKAMRIKVSKKCLEHFKNTTDFICRFVIVCETWVHHYTPEDVYKRQHIIFTSLTLILINSFN